MIAYKEKVTNHTESNGVKVPSFISNASLNRDEQVIDGFGTEWEKFSSFSKDEIAEIGDAYFSLLKETDIDENSVALDIGCGTGRWAMYLADKVKYVEAVDPSKAVFSAVKLTKEIDNIRISHCDIDTIPFAEESFDLVYSLGVFHHLPDTQAAISKAVNFVKPEGYFLVYLYYSLDNRGAAFKLLFHISNILRKVVCVLPERIKLFVCDILAIVLYMPFVTLAKVVKAVNPKGSLWKKIPLSAYAVCSFNIIRNDALDRFGTKLEKRFSRDEICDMLKQAGLREVKCSDDFPYWVGIGKK